MPKYKTRTRKTKKKAKVPKKAGRFTRDPRKLLRWAANGTNKDYEKLRGLAKKARESVPTYIDETAFERLARIDRKGMLTSMIQETQANEEHNISGGVFSDALGWLLDKVPLGNWMWPVAATQGALKAHKGDSENEVDAEYARLVGAAYKDDQPYVQDHWRRQTQFDSDYIAVWDNPDGHRLITIRGTKGAGDIGHDVMLGAVGRTTDEIGSELRVILDSTDPDSIVDVAAHSLGTGFALQAYNANREIYNRVHETYLYNPAYSPFMRGTSDQYEGDENVRYFINLGDPVSIGGIGHSPPANAVFRQPGKLGAMHSLSQWQGSGVQHAQYEPLLQRVQTYHEQSPFTRRNQEEEDHFYDASEQETKTDVGIPESASTHIFGEGTLDFGGDSFSAALASI